MRTGAGSDWLKSMHLVLLACRSSWRPRNESCMALKLVWRANCSEYFPIFIIILWVSGLFFSQGLSALCGLLYLYGRYQYFRGYAKSAHGRLAPLYFSAKVLWVLIGFSALGILGSMCRFYLDLDLKQLASSVLDLTEEEGGGL
uniref:Leukotriene C4 synthase n=1 Tax=Oncorhynchus tshawytscha TaxID=74940 RepID=A0AAZ3PWT1_ONCTS